MKILRVFVFISIYLKYVSIGLFWPKPLLIQITVTSTTQTCSDYPLFLSATSTTQNSGYYPLPPSIMLCATEFYTRSVGNNDKAGVLLLYRETCGNLYSLCFPSVRWLGGLGLCSVFSLFSFCEMVAWVVSLQCLLSVFLL